VVLGPKPTHKHHYGHIDALIGKNVVQEVFPHIITFLLEVDEVSPPPAAAATGPSTAETATTTTTTTTTTSAPPPIPQVLSDDEDEDSDEETQLSKSRSVMEDVEREIGDNGPELEKLQSAVSGLSTDGDAKPMAPPPTPSSS